MAAPLIGAIAAGVSAATGLASGIATMASGGDKRPKLGGLGEDAAQNLANTFAGRVSGTPQLGQGLGTPNTGAMPTAPNIGDIKNRLGNVGRNLGIG